MNFKDLIKKIALIGEAVAVSSIPGASVIDSSAHAIINAKTGAEKEVAIFDTAMTSFEEIENFKPDLIADPVAFKDAVVNIHKYSLQLHNSLKPAIV